MRPKKQERLIFRNKAWCIFDEALLEDAVLWIAEGNIKRTKTIFMQVKYPCINIEHKRIHVHRLIMCYISKRILDYKEYVHHIDWNKLNSSLDNLEIMDSSIHQSLHNKDKKLTVEHRRKIAEANRRRKWIKLKKHREDIWITEVYKLLNSWYSINKISKTLWAGWSTIKSRVNEIHENKDLLAS